ncbi:hypothetical protein [Sphingomonas aracearum]|uniref:Uncharacterized protein n=1 Tax=Sphingomonas aracearum TaxID=2283317 RepID=A0A369VUD1_9SPHN|nr:hypothetical protein [Sphingomonas aracearum]RDE05469.1 hypothetical protein DVW87_09500 [Sphingomonas aracearum]
MIRSARDAGCSLVVARSIATSWSSATFTGARHDLLLAGPATEALDAWLSSLPEAEIALRGHLVADVSVTSVQREPDGAVVRIEALTLVEA